MLTSTSWVNTGFGIEINTNMHKPPTTMVYSWKKIKNILYVNIYALPAPSKKTNNVT